jgi:hypothetical protein
MPERSKHRVLIDARDSGEITGRRKSLSRLYLTFCDGTPQIRCHYEIERDGLA